VSTPTQPAGSASGQDAGAAAVTMLGLGWFPDTLGGLERYYRGLLEALPEARGVVVGPAADAPARVVSVSRPDAPLARRLLAYRRAALRAGTGSALLDAHFALYASGPMLLSRLRSKPAVVHFQGPWADESVVERPGHAAVHVLRRALERAVLRRARAYVVLSSAFRRVLVERYGVSPWDVEVRAPGADLEHFTPGERSRARAALGLSEDAFVALSVRRLVPRTGVAELLDAWELAGEELPEGATLLVVGDGPLAAQLGPRAAAIGPREARLTGALSDEQLLAAYRAADVAVVPTLSHEGFGLVVVEAAACGTPSIVSDVDALPEVAGPLDPSLVVPAADAPAMAARLVAAARGALPSRASAREYAERFSWSAVAAAHRDLYRRVLAGERTPGRRVVYVDHVARLSGGEIALLRLLPHLVGVRPHVILGEDGPLALRLQQAGVSVEVLPLDPAARDLRRDSARAGAVPLRTALQTLRYTLRLARRLRRISPDVVHTNSLKAGVYGTLAARLAGVPVVWHLRDRIAEDYLPASAVRALRLLVPRLANGVVANSQATLDTLGATRRAWVIPDSVGIAPEPPEDDRRPPDAATFGMLGRIAPWKGQDLFLRAFAAAFPGGAERAVIIGTPMFGEEDYERGLHRLAAELGLSERVEFRGFREDVWGELAALDVLVHASVIPEPFGQVVLEGMAAGLPVLAPDEGGPAEVIDDGRTGMLYALGEQDALAAGMRALAHDAELRRRLGAAARQAAAAYAPEKLGARYEQAYEQLLK
jgi:glycosyltransferase involved in cell wall biosynthesis